MRSRTTPISGLLWSSARHLLLGAGAIVMLTPFVMMVAISVKSPGEVFAPTFKLIPDVWYWQNYTEAFTKQPLARYIFNGVLVGAAIFFFQALIAVPCAYALAKLRWRGSETTFVLVLLGLLVPPQVTAIPLYIGIWRLGLLDTYAAIILPSTISVFGIFLMRQFFRTVPDDLLHAARLDGLSEFAIVWRIVLPMAIPAMVSFGILSLIWNWNEFFWPLIVIQSEHLATPPLGISFFSNAEAGTNYGLLMAAAVSVNAPLIVAFLFAQRWFIDGVSMSAVK